MIIKIIAISEFIIILVLSFILVAKYRKWTYDESRRDKFEIYPSDSLLTKEILKEYGFRIHDTKSDIYATHPNGVSMVLIEGYEWNVEIRHLNQKYTGKIYTIGQLKDLCDQFDKTIIQGNGY